ncbi:MAG: hypothetical protein GX922_00875 [Firmicutes bacterium]|nr:hypothetical protein [Bacillota bacterium]
MQRTKFIIVLLALALFVTTALTGCGSQKEQEGITLKLGSQGFVEVEILAELAKILVEEQTPHKVEHVRNLGSSLAAHEATADNQLQMNNNFTGTLFLGLLEQELTDEWRDPDKVFQYVKDQMMEKYNMFVFPSYGYNNTYCLAVPRKWAEEHNVTKQSDLAPYAKDMTLAITAPWANIPGQGYNEYTELYGFKFGKTVEMNSSLMYIAIEKGEVDAINCFSTDGQLVAADLIALEDDLGFNPPYYGILIVRNDVLEEHPEIKDALMKVDGLISTEEMQQLNKRVAVDQEEPADVARDFLEKKGII